VSSISQIITSAFFEKESFVASAQITSIFSRSLRFARALSAMDLLISIA
jgi:hypothetical protein